MAGPCCFSLSYPQSSSISSPMRERIGLQNIVLNDAFLTEKHGTSYVCTATDALILAFCILPHLTPQREFQFGALLYRE